MKIKANRDLRGTCCCLQRKGSRVVKQSGGSSSKPSDSPSSWHIVHTWTARAQFVWGLWLTHPLCYLWWAKKSLVGEEVHSGGNTPRCGVQRVKRHEIMFSSGKCNQCEYDSSPSDDLRKHMASAQSTWQQIPPTQIHSWATQTQTGSNLRFTLPRNLPKPQMQRLPTFEEGCMSSDQFSREEKFRPLHLRQSNDRWRPVSASMAALLRRKSDDSRWLRVLKMPPDCHFDCPSAFCITLSACCSLHDPGN